MRRLLVVFVPLLLAACGEPQTVRFTGPRSADHARAAEILRERLSSYGSPGDPTVAGDTVTFRGRFKALSPKAVERLGRKGQLSFHIVEDERAQAAGAGKELCAADLAGLKEAIATTLVPGFAWLPMEGKPCALLVSGAKLTEADLEGASVLVDEMAGPQVQLRFNADGSELFAALTKQIKGKRMAIVLDGAVMSAPVVMESITGGRALLSLGGEADLATRREDVLALTRSLTGGRLPAHYRGQLAAP
jgi:preprotein translocase subunit SecD